ncbi:GNAT family N-acetyltransferase [Antarctobacter sp.]|uniref:GNAT family N-acetyltransferase n=1 Tax=Antarctobacter sp. TaxID=1872577 RepID=UPI003A923C2E
MIPAYRTATLAEVRTMLDWAAAEGWNPGLHDAEAFYATNPGGFFVAEVDGTLAAAISVVTHSDDFAFLGLYLCRPEYRGRGIGYSLWGHALKQAVNRTVGLDGVPEQEANYAKSGFVRTGRTRRYCGTLPATRLSVPIAEVNDAETLIKLDHAANGYARRRFLETWTGQSDTRKTILLRRGDAMSGFATARLCRQGCKIGPVVAPSVEDAFGLVQQAAAALDQTDVIVDVPDHATGLTEVLRGAGFVETFSTARMYRGTPPTVGETLHAIATMELG